MEKKMDYKDFSDSFGKWGPKFRPFIESEGMYNIYQRLKSDAFEERDGRFVRKEFITPDSDNTFRAFSTSDPDKVRVVWYLMDPYPRRYKTKELQATGIALDCSNTPDGKLQPSLIKFYEGMSLDEGVECKQDPSLEYLQEQGVLLLNTDLTCKLNKTGSHRGVWSEFQKFFLERIMGEKTGIIYILSGDESLAMEKYITPVGNYIFKTSHPMSASYSHTDWDSKGVFRKINTILRDHGNEPIHWNKDLWENLKELPF